MLHVREALERSQLDDRQHLVLEEHGEDDQIDRQSLAQAGADADIVLRRLCDQNRLLLERGLSDQGLADLETCSERSCAVCSRTSRADGAGKSSPSPSGDSIMKNAPCCAPTSGVSSDMIRRDTVSRSRSPCSIPVKRAMFEFSQSCSEFLRVVSARFSIIWLIVFFSSATSPWASTAIERVRSPCVTA